MEENLCFRIDWATLKLEVNLPFLICFTLYLRAIFQVQAPGQGRRHILINFGGAI